MTTHDIEWAAGLHQRIADAIRQARQERFTAQQVADETERLGYPISRSQIANYESGRKQGLDVAELLVLAAALRIPPIAVLCPGLPDGDAEMLPGWQATAADAMAWVTGESVDENDEEPAAGVWLVALTRRRIGAQQNIERLRGELETLALTGRFDVDNVDSALQASKLADEIADLNRQIAGIPGAVVATEKKGTK